MEKKWNYVSRLMGIDIFIIDEDDLGNIEEDGMEKSVFRSVQLRKQLIHGAKSQTVPYLYLDQYQVCFACIRQEKRFVLAGPMSLLALNLMELHKFYQNYGVEKINEKPLKHFILSQIFDMVNLLSMVLNEKEYKDEELMHMNQLAPESKKTLMQDKILFDLKKEEEELYHHTYQEEKALLDCVKEGRIGDALQYTRNMDRDLGKLSSHERNHWRNVAIVGITLCTRAAIEGGLSPAVAYRLSDFYIQKTDQCREIAQLLEYRNQAVEELAGRVFQQQEKRSRYNYVERCKDYVEQNYRKKIYLDEIAETLGISKNYLSQLFHREEKIAFQEYVSRVRVKHASYLLMYSEESLARIAEYVGFPSQSYMGKMFKKYMHTSPKKYRDQMKPTEFIEK